MIIAKADHLIPRPLSVDVRASKLVHCYRTHLLTFNTSDEINIIQVERKGWSCCGNQTHVFNIVLCVLSDKQGVGFNRNNKRK